MKNNRKQKIIRMLISIAIVVAICLIIYLPLQLTGTLAKIDSPEKLKELILKGGAYSYLVFFALQFLQVTFLPIPAFVTTVAGALVFGPLIGSLISLFAVMCGSLFAFFLGRKLGRNVVYWIVGKDEAIKWLKKLEKGKYVFFLMMLLPIFPDDILCLLVGATAMSYKFFIITNLITRPIAIFLTSYFGSGYLIPFSGWGIPLWILFVVVIIVLFVVSFKYQTQIENFVVRMGEKFSFKRKSERNLKNKNSHINQNENLQNGDIECSDINNENSENSTNINNKTEN